MDDIYNIHVHYVEIKYKDKLYIISTKVVEDIISYCKDITNLSFSSSSIDLSFSTSRSDNHIMGFICSQLVIKGNIPNLSHIARGIIGTDHKTVSRGQKLQNIYKSVFSPETIEPVPIIYPLLHSTKKQLYDEIPSDLYKLTWACRDVIYKDNKAFPCNKCSKCADMKIAGLVHNVINL